MPSATTLITYTDASPGEGFRAWSGRTGSSLSKACKNAALELAHHGLGVFDGLMGNRTAASIVENYQFSSDVTSTDMITAHEQARGVIRQLKDEIFDHIVSSSLRGVATAGTDADLTARLKIINEVWRNEISKQDKHSVYEELIVSSDWAAVTTVTCQDDATPTQLHKITKLHATLPGTNLLFDW